MVKENESNSNSNNKQQQQSEPDQREKQDLEMKARDGTITDQERTRLAELQRVFTYGKST